MIAILLSEVRGKKFKKPCRQRLPYLISSSVGLLFISIMFSPVFQRDGSVTTLVRGLSGEPGFHGDTADESGNSKAFGGADKYLKTVGWYSIIFFAAVTGIDSAV